MGAFGRSLLAGGTLIHVSLNTTHPAVNLGDSKFEKGIATETYFQPDVKVNRIAIWPDYVAFQPDRSLPARLQTFHNKKCCRSTTHTNRSTFLFWWSLSTARRTSLRRLRV